jgi:putative lipoic acid-binding regulatory protein
MIIFTIEDMAGPEDNYSSYSAVTVEVTGQDEDDSNEIYEQLASIESGLVDEVE